MPPTELSSTRFSSAYQDDDGHLVMTEPEPYLYRELPDLDQVLTRPDSAVVPREPAVLYALVGALVERCRADQAPLTSFVKYALRLPEEFAVLALRDALAVNPKLVALPAVQQWITQARAKGLFLAA